MYTPPLRSLPPEFPPRDLAENWLPLYCHDEMVLDQGNEGACTGYGLAAVINYLYWKDRITGRYLLSSEKTPRRVSPAMLYHLARIYDEWQGEDYEGSSCRGAMKGWHRHGVCEQDLWNHKASKKKNAKRSFQEPTEGWEENSAQHPLGAYYRIDKDSVGDMQAALYEVEAIYASANVHDGWERWNDDELSIIEPGDEAGGHAFALVGYNKTGFIVQNSWGNDWGYFGFSILPYEDWIRNGMDAWVAVMGAPVEQANPTATTGSTKKASSTPVSLFALKKNPPSRVGTRNPAAQPWAERQALKRTVVLGNNGVPIRKLFEFQTAADSIQAVCHDYPLEWLTRNRARRVAVYAHGGLNDEAASLKRIQILGPYFEANNIYPLFLTWRTGLLESLGGIAGDLVDSILPGRASFGWSDITDALSSWAKKAKDFAKEAKDRSIELACEKTVVKPVWTQMKQNADAAFGGNSGGALLSQHLIALRKELRNKVDFHFVGHSAGSLLLGHMLSYLGSRRVPVSSTSLFAPACTLRFALDHYKKAVNRRILPARKLWIENLDDEWELEDNVSGIYGKSLLYMVCRALESIHKMPLLGMQAAWEPEKAARIKWPTAVDRDLRQWSRFTRNHRIKPTYYGVRDNPVNNGVEKIPLGHGSFDNDKECIEKTLSRILNLQRVTDLRCRVKSLKGF